MAEPKKKAEETKDKAETRAKKDTKAAKDAPKKTKAESKKPEAKTKTDAKAESKAKPKSGGRKPAAKKDAAKSGAKAKAEPKTKEAKAAKPKEPVAPPKVHASARYVRIAPRKARHIADQIRGLAIDDARALLQFSSRGAARDVAKLLDSATANAENNHDLVADDLMISEIYVNDGPTLKRYRPRALGRATPINKRTSHISLALTPEDDS